jgi:hypothetical protein
MLEETMSHSQTGAAALRFHELSDWLVKHDFVCIAEGQVGDAAVEVYRINNQYSVMYGRLLIAYLKESGWELFAPVSDKLGLRSKLQAAENAVEERRQLEDEIACWLKVRRYTMEEFVSDIQAAIGKTLEFESHNLLAALSDEEVRLVLQYMSATIDGSRPFVPVVIAAIHAQDPDTSGARLTVRYTVKEACRDLIDWLIESGGYNDKDFLELVEQGRLEDALGWAVEDGRIYNWQIEDGNVELPSTVESNGKKYRICLREIKPHAP